MKFAGGFYSQSLMSSSSDRDVVNLFYGFLNGPENLPATYKDKNNNFQHDCPSIPGNSGSPVILLETGEVIGIHFNGKNQVNSAVSIDKVTQILDTL